MRMMLVFLLMLAGNLAFGQTHYNRLIKEMAAQNPITGNDIAVIVYNKSQCASCNSIISMLYQNVALKKKIPGSNWCIVMTPIREIERASYEEMFAFLDPRPKLIPNLESYNYLLRSLKTESYRGGVVILSQDDSIKFTVLFNDRDFAKKFQDYLEKNDVLNK